MRLGDLLQAIEVLAAKFLRALTKLLGVARLDGAERSFQRFDSGLVLLIERFAVLTNQIEYGIRPSLLGLTKLLQPWRLGLNNPRPATLPLLIKLFLR